MALYQPYSFSPKKTLRGGKTKHTMPAADFASALSGLLSIFSVSAWSVLMAVQKHILHDALHSCVGSGIGFSRYLFSCISGNTANKYLWARQLTRSSLHKNAFAEPVEYLASPQRYSLLASSHLEDLAARQLPSPSHAFPFSSLRKSWKCHFNAAALSAFPSLSLDFRALGATLFHSFVSLPLVLVMSGPRAIGIFRFPWKKSHRHFQTPLEKHCTVPDLFFLAKRRGAGERTMCLFSLHPQTSSALPLSSPSRFTYSLLPHPCWHSPRCTSHLRVSRKGSGAVKQAGLTHFPLLAGAGLASQLWEDRGLWLHNPPFPLHPEKIVFNTVC